MPGVPGPGAGQRAEPHIRLRPRRLEPAPGLAATAVPGRPEREDLRPGQRLPDLHVGTPASWSGLNEVSSVSALQKTAIQQAAYATFFAKRARISAVQVPQRAAVRSVHPVRVPLARRPPVPREDGHAAGVHLVLVRHRPSHSRPDHGDSVPGPVRTLVCGVRRRRPRTPAAFRHGPGRRAGPGGQGLRGHQRRAADPQPAAPGTPGKEPGPLPAAARPLPARAAPTAPKARAKPPGRTARSAPTSSTRPAPPWSATTT